MGHFVNKLNAYILEAMMSRNIEMSIDKIINVPLMSFRRPKSLGDYLVHSKLKRRDCTEPRPTGDSEMWKWTTPGLPAS